jgi:hypothetical protein
MGNGNGLKTALRCLQLESDLRNEFFVFVRQENWPNCRFSSCVTVMSDF